MVFHFQLVLSISEDKSTTCPYLGCLTTCDKVFHLDISVLANQSFENNCLSLQDKIWLLENKEFINKHMIQLSSYNTYKSLLFTGDITCIPRTCISIFLLNLNMCLHIPLRKNLQ